MAVHAAFQRIDEALAALARPLCLEHPLAVPAAPQSHPSLGRATRADVRYPCEPHVLAYEREACWGVRARYARRDVRELELRTSLACRA